MYIYTYTHTGIYIHMYSFMYLHICISINFDAYTLKVSGIAERLGEAGYEQLWASWQLRGTVRRRKLPTLCVALASR